MIGGLTVAGSAVLRRSADRQRPIFSRARHGSAEQKPRKISTIFMLSQNYKDSAGVVSIGR